MFPDSSLSGGLAMTIFQKANRPKSSSWAKFFILLQKKSKHDDRTKVHVRAREYSISKLLITILYIRFLYFHPIVIYKNNNKKNKQLSQDDDLGRF